MGTTPLFNHIGGKIRKYSRRGLAAPGLTPQAGTSTEAGVLALRRLGTPF